VDALGQSQPVEVIGGMVRLPMSVTPVFIWTD